MTMVSSLTPVAIADSSMQPQDAMVSLPILTVLECQDIRASLDALQTEWLHRNAQLPFYTLGAASYIDAAQSLPTYQQLAQRYNPILRDRFQWLYDRVATALAGWLQAPVDCADHLALPGFHIYQSCKLFEQPIASIHCDSQYQLLPWPTAETDFSRPLSFTLAIALPKFGGGLNLWDLHYRDIQGLTPKEFQQLVHDRPYKFHPYQVGHLVLHSGHQLHQAAPARNIQPEDERITLQGHSVWSQGRWRLYW
jgi:hypothetical protein